MRAAVDWWSNGHHLADAAGPTGFKQQILSDAAKFYQQLASIRMNDERDLRELSLRSSGYGRIAQIQDYLQNDAEAAEARRRAIEVMQQALAVDPQHAGIWSDAAYENYLLGQSLVELYEDAIGNFERSASLRTHDHAYDWLQLAIAHAHLGHRKEAKQWFDKAEEFIGQTANPHVELIELRDAAASVVSDHHIEDRTVIENLQ